MSAIVTGPYAFFITSAYAATFLVLAGLVVWVAITAGQRRRAFERLKKAGIVRSGS